MWPIGQRRQPLSNCLLIRYDSFCDTFLILVYIVVALYQFRSAICLHPYLSTAIPKITKALLPDKTIVWYVTFSNMQHFPQKTVSLFCKQKVSDKSWQKSLYYNFFHVHKQWFLNVSKRLFYEIMEVDPTVWYAL